MKKFVLLIVVVLLGCYAWYAYALSPVDASSQTRTKVTINRGASTTSIAQTLAEEGIIRSPLAFRIHVRLQGLDGSLQAGVFLLQPSFSADEIIAMLQSGRAAEVAITIPEGFTVKDIDALLTELELIEAGEVVDCSNICDFATYDFLPEDTSKLAERGGRLEGYLYPDTYYAPVDDFVAKFFLERMLNAFRSKILEPYEGVILSSDYSLHDIVTVASLIEEETRTDDERGPVSGIIWKRYEAGWGLGIDAAVRYIVDKPSDDITTGDLNINSPYNLRKFTGLTPGPIANAGKKSIEAALYPKETPYWYYLHDRTGQIHYSRTNEEHNLKRIKYLSSKAF